MAIAKIDHPEYTLVIAGRTGGVLALCTIGPMNGEGNHMIIDVRPGVGPSLIGPMLDTIKSAFNAGVVMATNRGVPINPTTLEPIQ
jgi:hypothetical protein